MKGLLAQFREIFTPACWWGDFPDQTAKEPNMTTNADTQAFIDTVLTPRVSAALANAYAKGQADAQGAAQTAQDAAVKTAVDAANAANETLLAEIRQDHADDLAALQAKLDALIPPPAA